MLTHSEFIFAQLVGLRVKEQYDFDDGDDLCLNLRETGAISATASVDEAARIVAMHIAQP